MSLSEILHESLVREFGDTITRDPTQIAALAAALMWEVGSLIQLAAADQTTAYAVIESMADNMKAQVDRTEPDPHGWLKLIRRAS